MQDNSTDMNIDTNLSNVSLGALYRIKSLRLTPETCQQLREIGLAEATLVRPISKNAHQMICEAHNMRIGMQCRTARGIRVVQVSSAESEGLGR